MSALMDPDTFSELTKLVREFAGLALGPDKRYLFEARLRPILARHGLESFRDLRAALARDRNGLRIEVVQALVTHETSFFRDRAVFDHLERRVIPELAERRGGRVRIWSAATSTGQEAWTLAIIAERIGRARPGTCCEIVASDLSAPALARAREGLYTTFEVQRGLTARELVDYFQREGDEWKVRSELFRHVKFFVHNLLDPPDPLGPPFDLILLRNVLIYMDAPTRDRVLRHVLRALTGGGYLLVGTSELLPPSAPFQRESGVAGLYRRATLQRARQATAGHAGRRTGLEQPGPGRSGRHGAVGSPCRGGAGGRSV